MVPSTPLAFILTTLTALAVRADVTPNEPGPGSVFRQGQKCRTAWTGDKDGNWGDMAIELMTGDNLHMIHLTTVATGLDGNKDGKFEFDCPEVDPFSAIYFFQYSAPKATGFQWATRFAIADPSGKTVPPAQDTQPDGQKIPWGVGKLVDASKATPPPPFQNGGSSSNSTSTTSTSSTSTSTSSNSTSTTAASPTTSAKMVTITRSPEATGTPASGNANTNANTNGTAAGKNNDSNGALPMGINQAWQATLILAVTASTFAFCL
ncbi:hypothetical protein V5O48_005024 [Marasmius crinis-equi]|uniref:Uncharacterized protein n=1 Tax=Marasmius crinis-equi TaxID=585013 RepID=A0ABR3FNG0_9AGAR